MKRPLRTLGLLATALLALAPIARAEELRPGELADRLERARRSAHEAFLGLDSDDEDAALADLRRDSGRLAGARVKAGAEMLDVDPGLAKELARLDEDPSPGSRRDRVAHIERRLAALEREARRAAEVAPPAADGTPQPGLNQLQPARPRGPAGETGPAGSREVLSKVLDRPQYRKRAENVDTLGLSEKLESVQQRILNWWIRFMQPTPTLPRPAWLTALLGFLASIFPTTRFGWAVVAVVGILVVALFIWWRVGRGRKFEDARPLSLDAGLDGQVMPRRIAPEESYSEDEWRREARQLAKQGELRGAIRALYTGVLLSLQRAGRLKFDKGKTNWEHVRELRRNDRALAQRLEPLTRTFDVAWYGQKPVEPAAFEAFLAETDAFAGAVRGDAPAAAEPA